MKRILTFASTVLALVVVLASTPVAYGNTVSLTLLNPVQTAALGKTVSFFATVSAASTNTGNEFLNGDTFSVSLPTTLNDSGYLNNFPFFLTPGQSFTGLLFTILIPTSAPYGGYPGTFSITGGLNPSSSGVLASANFDVGAVPEPSTFLLLGTGIAGLAAIVRRRRNPSLA